MDFSVRISSIMLDKAATCAFTKMRDVVWREVLEKCREKIKTSTKRSAAAKEAGLLFVDKIISREAATSSGDDAAKRTHEYLFEERLRGKLVSLFEDMFPFVWDCPWPATAFRSYAAEINYLLSPIGASKSRLLSRTPIALIAEVFHALQNKGADDISWWKTASNEKYLADAAVRFMRGIQDKEVLEQKERLLKAVFAVIFAFFQQNSSLFADRSKFSELSSLDTEMEAHFVKRVSRSGSSDTTFLCMERSEIMELIQTLGSICIVTKA